MHIDADVRGQAEHQETPHREPDVRARPRSTRRTSLGSAVGTSIRVHQATGHARGESGCRPSAVSGPQNSHLANSSIAPPDWQRSFPAVAASGPQPTRWARPHPPDPAAGTTDQGLGSRPSQVGRCFDRPRAILEPPQSPPPGNLPILASKRADQSRLKPAPLQATPPTRSAN